MGSVGPSEVDSVSVDFEAQLRDQEFNARGLGPTGHKKDIQGSGNVRFITPCQQNCGNLEITSYIPRPSGEAKPEGQQQKTMLAIKPNCPQKTFPHPYKTLEI